MARVPPPRWITGRKHSQNILFQPSVGTNEKRNPMNLLGEATPDTVPAYWGGGVNIAWDCGVLC